MRHARQYPHPLAVNRELFIAKNCHHPSQRKKSPGIFSQKKSLFKAKKYNPEESFI